MSIDFKCAIYGSIWIELPTSAKNKGLNYIYAVELVCSGPT